MTISAYLNCVKDLSLSVIGAAKSQIRDLILEKTSVPEEIKPAKIKLEREAKVEKSG